jgi:hypothetical protein
MSHRIKSNYRVANEELAENRSRPDAPQGKPSEKLSIAIFSFGGKAYFFKSQPCRTPDQQVYSGWDEQLWNLVNSIFTRGRIVYCLLCSKAIVLSFVCEKAHLGADPRRNVPNGRRLAGYVRARQVGFDHLYTSQLGGHANLGGTPIGEFIHR